MRRAATAHLSFTVAGDRYEAAFLLQPGKHWSRFKSPGLPHLAGCHLYAERAPNGALLCAIRPNNGTLEADRTWRGVFAFSDFKIEVRGYAGTMIVEGRDPQNISLECSWEGETHTFLPRAGFRIRFAVAVNDWTASDALAYADRIIAEPAGGDYDATESKLPNVTQHAAWYKQHYGQKYVEDRVGDPSLFRPKGVDGAPWDGMAPGGDGIFPDGHGYQQCREYVLHSRSAFSDWMDRVGPIYLFDSKGRQLSVNSWPHYIGYAEVQQGPRTTNRDLPMFLTMGAGWGNQAYIRLTPDAGQALWHWQAMAISHMIRVVHHGIATYEFTRDPMVRDDLVAIFRAYQCLDWNHRTDAPIKDQNSPAWFPQSLTSLAFEAKWSPGRGAPIDRACGWMGALGAYLVKEQAIEPEWLVKWCELIEDSATPDGINNVMHAPNYMPANCLGTQLFHDTIIKWAYIAACQTLDRDGTELLYRWFRGVIDNPRLPFLPYKWAEGAYGPPWWIATRIDGIDVPVSGENATGCGKPGWSTDYQGTIEHILPALAGIYRMLKDRGQNARADAVLAKSLTVWIPHTTLAEREAWLAGATEMNWKREMLSALQLA